MTTYSGSEALEIAMQIEKNGAAFYNKAAEKVEDKKVKDFFMEMSEQEELNYKTFQDLAGSGDSISITSDEWNEYEMYLTNAMDSTFFKSEDKAISRADEARNLEDALRISLAFEKDTLIFFNDLKDFVTGPGKSKVDRIIKEERKHLKRLANMLSNVITK